MHPSTQYWTLPRLCDKPKCSSLLAFHVFMWTLTPHAENDGRSLAFWIVAGVAAWVLGFPVILAFKAPYLEVLAIDDDTICTKSATGDATEILELCLSNT